MLFFSPIAAQLAKLNPFKIISIGMSLWAIAVLGCGIAWGFTSLVIFRALVGVGEASFISLASPFIDDHAPPQSKSLWLGILALCIPTGYAIGYVYGGVVGSILGWRATFMLLGVGMVPLLIFLWLASPVPLNLGTGTGTTDSTTHNSTTTKHDEYSSHYHNLIKDVKELLSIAGYTWTVFSLTIYTAVLGTLGFFGPKAGKEIFHIAPASADIVFGIITIICGIGGSLLGGMLLDKLGGNVENAARICMWGNAGGALFLSMAFYVPSSFAGYMTMIAVGEMFLFSTSSSGSALCLWGVPVEHRPMAVAMSVVLTHLLGDVPAPPLIGLVQSSVRNWRVTLGCFVLLLFGSAAAFSIVLRKSMMNGNGSRGLYQGVNGAIGGKECRSEGEETIVVSAAATRIV